MNTSLSLAFAAALLLGPTPASAQAAADAARLARIDSLARREADARLLSSIILIARGDRVLFQRGYGFENWESLVPNSPATRFEIGSITKVMTDLLIDRLVSEGRLGLDDPVTKYLGDFPRGPRGGAVTVRQLLEHRSGVPWRVTTESEETERLHPADIVDRVRARGLLFEPGTAELYSSAGYTCLARVIELIEGKPFDVVLRERVFQPAAMAQATDETGPALMVHRAMPYRLGASGTTIATFHGPVKDFGFLAGAGSVYATADDLLHFIRALRNGAFGATGRAQVADSAELTWRAFYGRTTNGYEASIDYNPAGDVTFVFLSNLQSTSTWQLRQEIRNVLLGRPTTPIARPPAVAANVAVPDSAPGAYGDPTDPIVISVVDGHVFRDDAEVYPIAGGSYFEPGSGLIMRFRKASDGRVDALISKRPWREGETIELRVPAAAH